MFYINHACYKESNCCVYTYDTYGLKRINTRCKVSVYTKRTGFIPRSRTGTVFKARPFLGPTSRHIKFAGIISKWVRINRSWEKHVSSMKLSLLDRSLYYTISFDMKTLVCNKIFKMNDYVIYIWTF